MPMDDDIWGFSLFCDDIRQEAGGKISLMGIYHADMFFQGSTPFHTPRFVAMVMIYGTPGNAMDMNIRVYLPGDNSDNPSITVPVPASAQMVQTAPNVPLDPDQQIISHFRFPIILQPLIVQKPGFVKVRIERGGKVYNFGSLHIRGAREDEATAPDLIGFAPTPNG